MNIKKKKEKYTLINILLFYFVFLISLLLLIILSLINKNYCFTGTLVLWVEYSPMVRETGVQPQLEVYQRL